MNLEGVLTIGGKPGLYRQLSQSKSGIIVETIPKGKRFLAHFSSRINLLEEICLYTESSEKPLKEVFKLIQKQNKDIVEFSQNTEEELRDYIKKVVPDYDSERVYYSDLKKLFNWYNILSENGYLKQKTSKNKRKKNIK